MFNGGSWKIWEIRPLASFGEIRTGRQRALASLASRKGGLVLWNRWSKRFANGYLGIGSRRLHDLRLLDAPMELSF